MARKNSSRRAAKKIKKTTTRKNPIARKKPAKRKPTRNKAGGMASENVPVAAARAGDHPIAYLTGGTTTSLPAS